VQTSYVLYTFYYLLITPSKLFQIILASRKNTPTLRSRPHAWLPEGEHVLTGPSLTPSCSTNTTAGHAVSDEASWLVTVVRTYTYAVAIHVLMMPWDTAKPAPGPVTQYLYRDLVKEHINSAYALSYIATSGPLSLFPSNQLIGSSDNPLCG
jgi:hypothetical protein